MPLVSRRPFVPRKALLSDLPELMRLETAGFASDELSHRSLRRLLQSPTALCLVVDGGAHLLGYALWLFRRNSVQARLYSVAVDDRSRGLGVGLLLLQAGERLARQHGCNRMSLEVKTDNAGAIHLYRKLGFREGGVRPGYYEDGADALRMIKELPGRADLPVSDAKAASDTNKKGP